MCVVIVSTFEGGVHPASLVSTARPVFKSVSRICQVLPAACSHVLTFPVVLVKGHCFCIPVLFVFLKRSNVFLRPVSRQAIALPQLPQMLVLHESSGVMTLALLGVDRRLHKSNQIAQFGPINHESS